MNRRTFFQSLFAGVLVLPSICAAQEPVRAVSAKLFPCDYTTRGVFQLADLNEVFTRFARLNKGLKPTLLRLGRFEDEQLSMISWCPNYRPGFIPRKEDSPDYWNEQWRKGNRWLPWRRDSVRIEIANAEYYCTLS